MFKFLKKMKAARETEKTAETIPDNRIDSVAAHAQRTLVKTAVDDKAAANGEPAPTSSALESSNQETQKSVPEPIAESNFEYTPKAGQNREQTDGVTKRTPSSLDASLPDSMAKPAPQSSEKAPALEPKLTADLAEDRTSAESTELEQKLDKSRAGFGKKFKQLFSVRKKIDDDLLEDIETTLLLADVGATATTEIVDKVAKSVKRRQLDDSQAVSTALREHLRELAQKVEKPLQVDAEKKPFVILVTGVNGVGKTTTIAKLARRLKEEGKSVMLAAGDTFRAAAVEQLKTWGEREGIPVIAQATGADSASVIFDALSAAKARSIDVLIADTAGRLHTQSNLMQELEKINRVMKKADPHAPHETLIVVDGGTGQNAIAQVREFNKAVDLTGIVVTKLDGTAKGGVLFNLAREFGLPVRFIGVGEKSSDLKPYRAEEFVAALME